MVLGRRGDADILLVHSPADEESFMAAGYGARRLPVMANDFIIAGSPDDPAGIRDDISVVSALRRIAARGAPFVSRGDGSGTHRKELELWTAAGTLPRTRMEVGQGMGEALTIASERGAYILSDRGTYLSLSNNLRLEVLVQGDALLKNPYSVITVRGSRNADAAEALAEWLTSEDAAERIRTYGVAGWGQPLFFPAVDAPGG
jgi:tungstate transport system substrate-binding protein